MNLREVEIDKLKRMPYLHPVAEWRVYETMYNKFSSSLWTEVRTLN